MKLFFILSAIFACALANGYGGQMSYGGSDMGSYGGSDMGNYGGSDMGSYGGDSYGKVAIVKTPIYKQTLISKTVKLGESHKSYPVQEARFTRSDYETPGATYAIPATKTIQLTRPAYTTYLKSSITKAHVTNHQLVGPTHRQPIIKNIVSKVLVPAPSKSYESHGSYGGDSGASGYESQGGYGGQMSYGGDSGASGYESQGGYGGQMSYGGESGASGYGY